MGSHFFGDQRAICSDDPMVHGAERRGHFCGKDVIIGLAD